MVLKDLRFKSGERIYTIDFSLSLEIKSLDILPKITKLYNIENIIHIFCLGQSWYDLCILRQWTSLKLRDHTKFVLRKNYLEYF